MFVATLWLVQILLPLWSCNGFTPRSNAPLKLPSTSAYNRRDRGIITTKTMMVPIPLEELSNIFGGSDAIDVPLENSNLLLSAMTAEKSSELGKAAVITLLFGGGLIPAAIDANKSLIGTLRGKRRGGEDTTSSPYISSSDAAGPPLPNSFLLFPSETIPLVDIIAIIGRIEDLNSIADWKNLDSVKLSNSTGSIPPMWLSRGEYKKNVRSAKWKGWPKDRKTGEPVGGRDLEREEGGRIGRANVVIGDAALDAVFDSWAWGSSIATPDKVETTLALFKQSDGSFNLDEFVQAAARGRAVTGFAALTFVFIQIIAYSCLFIAPLLRVVFNIDIGFGVIGDCDGTCTTLF